MHAFAAVFYREAKIRMTNLTFIFWDLFYPLCYMLVFGVGINSALGSPFAAVGVDYNAFFLAGVLAMASFGIASNTAWSFFLDRDKLPNGRLINLLQPPQKPAQIFQVLPPSNGHPTQYLFGGAMNELSLVQN